MGNLFSWITSYFAKKEQRLLFMGLDAAGKTTILYKLKLPNEKITTIPTVGFNVETVQIGKTDVTIWDVGGGDKIRPLFKHYFKGCDGVVLVLDSNDRDRMKELNADFIEMLLGDDQLQHAILLILANKQDLPRAMSISELSERLAVDKIRQKTWQIMPCCATSGEGLAEAMSWISEQVEAFRLGNSTTTTTTS